jgi:cation diffusion facilitator CzcD-associated flavoprotein CzcO
MNWDDEAKEWIVKMINIAHGHGGKEITVRSDFVLMSPGILHNPKLPAVPGIESFKGPIFHTSRWDYNFTGGSPDNPFLTKLQDKSVGVIGTGASAVQLVPIVAKWSKKLYVFQRTPSSVNRRDNRPTNPEEWKENIATKKGWWRARNENYNACLAQSLPPNTTNLVDDEWTKMPTYFGLIGSPRTVNPAEAPAFVAELYTRDIPYAEKVRARVSEMVKDEETAKNLKHWYPSWCKRPTFHDEYLQAFNQPNVKLVHTDGKSISNITSQGVVFADKEYPIDILIFATGYEIPAKRPDPASRAGIEVIGRSGRSIVQKFAENGDTLHGVITRDFPNLLWTGPGQAGVTANCT